VSDATPHAGFGRPGLTAFARLDGLGLAVIGQRLEPGRVALACRVVEADGWCRRCGAEGLARDTVVRRLAHEPLGWRPTTLEVAKRRYQCRECGHVWRQDTSLAAEPRAKLSRRGQLMVKLIDSISSGVPKALTEIVTLGRTLKKRAADVLAYFDRPKAHPTDQPRRSTADSNTSAAAHSASAT